MNVFNSTRRLEVLMLDACWSERCLLHGDRMAMVELERALQLADADASAASSGLVVFDTAKVPVFNHMTHVLSCINVATCLVV